MNATSGTGTSLERLLSILSLFTEDHLEWTPDEMIARLGYSRPTLYRYVRTLRDAGLLTDHGGHGLMLGPRVVELDYLMRMSDPLVADGQPRLETLAAQHPSTTFLVRWYGRKLLCIASACSTPDPVSSYPRGRPMPLARGAISRVILANLPKRQMLARVSEDLEDLRAVGLGDTAEEVIEALRQVRREGVAVAHGEVTPGVIGIAAPVFDATRVPVAALCMTLSAHRIQPSRIAELRVHVRATAAALSSDRALHRADAE